MITQRSVSWLFLMLMLALPVVVQAQFTFTTNNGTITITGYTGPTPVWVTIPSTTNGYPVTSIGSRAFFSGWLTGVTIPDSVTNISGDAFRHCILPSITIPNSVITIGTNAFYQDAILTNAFIGASVSSIGDSAFYQCYALNEIDVDAENIHYSSVNGVLFDYNQATLLVYPEAKTGAYTIPSSVSTVTSNAFQGCGNLTSTTIPNSVTNIGRYAFHYCTNLTGAFFHGNAPSADTSVFSGDSTTVYYLAGTTGWGATFSGRPATLWDPQSSCAYTVTNGGNIITGYIGSGGAVALPSLINSLPVIGIGSNAFKNCTSLTSIIIPNMVTNIATSAFLGCTGLTAISVDPLNEFYSSINGVLFDGSGATLIQYPIACLSNSYTVPSSVTSIAISAFQSCANLKSVTLPNNVTNIDAYAFCSCTSLVSVIMGTGVRSIGNSAFQYCPLNNISIADSVLTVGAYAFASCSTASNVTIGSNVVSLGNDAFAACSALTSVVIPNSVATIGVACFYDCVNLTSLTLGNSLTSIASDAFEFCGRLRSVSIPNSVTNIGDSAFYNCQALTNVTIGAGVVGIGDQAFGITVSLQTMRFEGNTPGAPPYVLLDSNPALVVYYNPGTTGWGTTFGGFPTAPWPLAYPVILNSDPSFGAQSSGFGLTICWGTNLPAVVETCTDLATHTWYSIATNALTNGLTYFSDPQWTNYARRFYRIRSP